MLIRYVNSSGDLHRHPRLPGRHQEAPLPASSLPCSCTSPSWWRCCSGRQIVLRIFLVTILCININYPVVDGRHSFAAPAALNYNQMPSTVVVGGQTHGPVNYLPPSFSYPPQPPVAPKVFSGPCYKCKKFGHKAFQCKEP